MESLCASSHSGYLAPMSCAHDQSAPHHCRATMFITVTDDRTAHSVVSCRTHTQLLVRRARVIPQTKAPATAVANLSQCCARSQRFLYQSAHSESRPGAWAEANCIDAELTTGSGSPQCETHVGNAMSI